jgi:hypothetical protein
MTLSTTYTYTCDRCGKQQQTGWMKKLHWSTFMMWTWDHEKDLCDDCLADFNAFMTIHEQEKK